jgi:hypothetical protein
MLYQFTAEARRLLEVDTAPCLTTIQGMLVMSIVANMSGIDKVGWKYCLDAVSMAYSLRLFESSSESATKRSQASRALTAWGVFTGQAWVQAKTYQVVA